jgi:hypothetical protein
VRFCPPLGGVLALMAKFLLALALIAATAVLGALPAFAWQPACC